ncbi:MAG: ABC-F family ATP-binding cassette domain-containing protein [Phycisphaerales bacterium]
MALLSLANVHHAFGNHVVLDGVTMSIEPGQKIGLVGRNGSGKTTLMKVMLKELAPDAGAVQVQRSAGVGYLSQDPEFDPTDTVREAAERAFANLHDLHVQIKAVFEDMAQATGDELEKLLRRQAALESKIEATGGYAIDHKIDATLHGLGFPDDQFGLNVQVVSGGQKSRLALAKLLLEAPDLLLLDEPTNHLDIDGRQWLETFLAEEYRGAVVLVSHDRWLLDRVVSRIVQIGRGAVREYPGNYSKYVQLRQQQQFTDARTYEKQLDKIRAEEQFIRRYKAGQRSKQAKGRESRLERFKRDELIERPIESRVMNLRLPKAPRSGDQVAVAERIAKRYGENVLFEDFSISIMRGDRIGVIGPNGAGKTTLIKCLLGELEHDEGTVRLGSRVSIGYYRQLHEHLDLELSVWAYLQSVIVSVDGQVQASEQQARDLAGAFLFSGDEQDKPLGNLSGGERSRAVLAGLVASARNLLVLDEPTNHLDIPSAERLEQVLRLGGAYQGTLLLVTHDRALLDATCDKLLVFDGDGALRLFHGRYSQWATREDQADRSPSSSQPKPVRKKRSVKTQAPPLDAGLSALSLSKIEQRIERLEQRKSQIDGEMLDPKVYRDGPRCKALRQERARLVAELSEVEKEWARRAAQA